MHGAAGTKHSFVPCNRTKKKQQLLSSSQAYRLAAHSSRASSAPPPRCQRQPASLQLSRFVNRSRLRQSLPPIAFAFCARRFPGRAAPTVSRRARRRARPARAALRHSEVWVEPAPAHGTPSRAVVLASEDLLPYRAEYEPVSRLLLCLIVQPKLGPCGRCPSGPLVRPPRQMLLPRSSAATLFPPRVSTWCGRSHRADTSCRLCVRRRHSSRVNADFPGRSDGRGMYMMKSIPMACSSRSHAALPAKLDNCGS